MVSFVYSLSDLQVAVLFGSVFALVFAAAPLVRAKLFGRVSEASSEVARTTMTTVTGFTGAVLAFSLVQAQGNLRSVERAVAGEAMQLSQMDRLLAGYGDPAVAAIRETARVYAESIVTDEWPKLSEHSSSEHTADLFQTLSRQVLAIRPPPGRESAIYGDLMKIVDQLAESRVERLNASDLGLPPIFWEVIALLTVLLVALCACIDPSRAVFLGGLGAGLALLITLVFIFDQPFLGNVSVSPDPIAKVLQAMRARSG